MDNLNTHTGASLYKTFPPALARELMQNKVEQGTGEGQGERQAGTIDDKRPGQDGQRGLLPYSSPAAPV